MTVDPEALLSSAHEPTRLRGVHHLRDAAPNRGAAAVRLVAVLADPGSYVPHAARAALQDLGADAIPALIEGLRHTDAVIRTHCAWALARPQGDAAGDVATGLRAVAGDAEAAVRHAIAGALGRIGAPGDVGEVLARLCADGVPRVRAEAVRSAAAAGCGEEILLDALDDGVAQVRLAAAEALAGRPLSPQGRPRVRQALAEEVDPAVRPVLAAVAERIP